MFGKLELPTFKAEVLTAGYMLRTSFQPKGDMLIYMNDQRYSVIRFDDVEFFPIMPEAQVRGVKQEAMAVSKSNIVGISILDEDKMDKIQMMASKRPFIFYTAWFAIQGDLHVNPDAREDDVFDETRDFFAITNAIIFPLRKVRMAPARKVPFFTINQHTVFAYHPHQSAGE